MIGAGVVEGAGLPGGAQLGKVLVEEFDPGGLVAAPQVALPILADELVSHGLCGEDQLIERLAAEMMSWKRANSQLLDTLVRIPSAFLATFNYDDTIEHSAREALLEPRSLGNSPADFEEAIEILGSRAETNGPTVLHLHGRVERPEEIVLGSRGYRRLQSGAYGQLLRKLVVEKTLIFFGTTLDESEFLHQIAAIPDRESHLLFCLDSEREELTRKRAPILSGKHDIHVVGVKHYGELVLRAARLLEGDWPDPGSLLVPPVALGEGPYVANTLRNLREPAPEGPEALAAAVLDADLPPKPPPDAHQVLSGPRTLIIGDPGTGKTELLLRVAAGAAPSLQVFVIRLADVALNARAGGVQTLSKWIEEGTAFQDGAEASAAILERERFHFLLDGLDEVASERQEEMAQFINRCAEELPQHRFTLATRPLPSLDFLRINNPQASDWTHLRLEPDAAWRDRFLGEVEVTLEQLEDDMPALASMEEVLNTPFYLRHIVELHRKRRLRGLGDFGQLLWALVELAIEREEGSVQIGAEEIRAWLRRVALSGLLSGRRTFSEADLREIEPPAGGQDPISLARTLEQRLLLAEDRGAFRFHHRLLGEQLSAEALVEAGPLPDLIDCLVPYLDQGLQGVRPDAVIPVGLACLTSEDFRAAVSERDPLAAARATPDRAPREERESALAALWSEARHLQVWAWEHGGELTDDAEAMGRLMRTLEDSTTAASIKDAVNAPSEQDQGNALRVISRAKLDGLEPVLAEVLSQHERNGVVLRQALSAAADSGFDGLLDAIVSMLKNQPERVVHQVGIHALQRLVSPERRLELFTELMEGPEADYALAAALDDLRPAEAMHLLAAYLAAGGERNIWGRRRVGPIFDQLAIAELSECDVEAAVKVSLGLRLDHDRVGEICELHPSATMRALAALAADDYGWWEVQQVAVHFEPAALRNAGLPTEVVDRVDQYRRNREIHARAAADGTLAQLIDPPEEREEVEEPPTLAALLDRSDSDPEILGNAEYFASQVEDLDPGRLEELRRRLLGWWPDKPFSETITPEGPNSWSQEREAFAWSRLGPAARPPLSDPMWAELATSRILFDEHTAWLRATQTSAATYAALALIGADGDPDRWYQFLGCCSDPVPNAVLVGCVDRLDAESGDPSGPKRHYLRTIGQRVLANGRPDLLRRLAERSPYLREMAGPLLAGAGDLDAQCDELDAAIRLLDAGKLPEISEMNWMGAISSPSLLPRLFSILERTYGESDEPVRVVSGYGLRDIVTPTIETIARIGGREAVAGYDRLISPSSFYRWLSQARERVAGAALIADGQRFAPRAAAAGRVPLLAPEPNAIE